MKDSLPQFWSRLKSYPAPSWWRLFKILAGAILWLGLVVLTYYSLVTVPALALVTVWLYIALTHNRRQPRRRPPNWPDEDDPKGAVRSGER